MHRQTCTSWYQDMGADGRQDGNRHQHRVCVQSTETRYDADNHHTGATGYHRPGERRWRQSGCCEGIKGKRGEANQRGKEADRWIGSWRSLCFDHRWEVADICPGGGCQGRVDGPCGGLQVGDLLPFVAEAEGSGDEAGEGEHGEGEPGERGRRQRRGHEPGGGHRGRDQRRGRDAGGDGERRVHRAVQVPGAAAAGPWPLVLQQDIGDDLLLLLQEHHLRRHPLPVRGLHLLLRPDLLQRLGAVDVQRLLHVAAGDRHGSVRPGRVGALLPEVPDAVPGGPPEPAVPMVEAAGVDGVRRGQRRDHLLPDVGGAAAPGVPAGRRGGGPGHPERHRLHVRGVGGERADDGDGQLLHPGAARLHLGQRGAVVRVPPRLRRHHPGLLHQLLHALHRRPGRRALLLGGHPARPRRRAPPLLHLLRRQDALLPRLPQQDPVAAAPWLQRRRPRVRPRPAPVLRQVHRGWRLRPPRRQGPPPPSFPITFTFTNHIYLVIV